MESQVNNAEFFEEETESISKAAWGRMEEANQAFLEAVSRVLNRAEEFLKELEKLASEVLDFDESRYFQEYLCKTSEKTKIDFNLSMLYYPTGFL